MQGSVLNDPVVAALDAAGARLFGGDALHGLGALRAVPNNDRPDRCDLSCARLDALEDLLQKAADALVYLAEPATQRRYEGDEQNIVSKCNLAMSGYAMAMGGLVEATQNICLVGAAAALMAAHPEHAEPARLLIEAEFKPTSVQGLYAWGPEDPGQVVAKSAPVTESLRAEQAEKGQRPDAVSAWQDWANVRVDKAVVKTRAVFYDPAVQAKVAARRAQINWPKYENVGVFLGHMKRILDQINQARPS